MALPVRRGPPVPGRPLLLRPRLLALLQQRFELRALVLVAQAGFGKTTLLTQAVAENELSPRGRDLWVPCQAEDAVLSVLAAGLYRALGLEGRPPSTPREAAAEIADAVWAAAPDQVTLLLDDVHHVTPGSPGHDLLVELLAQLPGNGHLVLAARSEPALPLSRLRATGEALVVDAAQLAFTAGELEDFAALRHVPPDRLSRVGGWPALAELTASAGPRAVSHYLNEELLASLSAPQRRALAALVAVGGADEELAEAVPALHDLRHLLEDLPLVSTTADGWWTAHPLWAEALAGELGREEVAAARRSVAAVLRGRGQLHDAMRQLLLAEAWEAVRQLLTEVCANLSPAVPTDVLAQWQARLPAEVQETPEGLLLAGMLTESTDPEQGRQLLERAYAECAGEGPVALPAVQSLILIAFWRNDARGLTRLVERLGRLTAGRPEAEALHRLVRALLTMDAAEVQAHLRDTPLSADRRLAPILDWLRAHLLLLHVGDPAAALPFARAALDRAEVTLRSTVRADLVEALRLLGRVDEAAAEVPALLADVELSVVRSPRHLLAAAVATEVRGDRGESEPQLAALRAAVCASPFTWVSLACALAEALHAVTQGREQDAAEQLRQVGEHPQARVRALLRMNPVSLPLSYVLLPETRRAWDSVPLAGCHAETRSAAAALVAIRETRSVGPVRDLHLDWDHVRGQLPLPWTVELAAASAAAGVRDAEGVLRQLRQAARAPLRALLQSPVRGVPGTARTLLSGLPARPAYDVRVEVLGPLRLLRGGAEVLDPDLRRERVRYLLGMLLVSRSLPRARVAAELWPDLDEPAAARNLRVTLNYLQRLLEPDRDEHEAPYFLRTTAGVLELADDAGISTDFREFEAALLEAEEADAHAAPSLATTAYRRAVDLYRGPFLAELPDTEWLDLERDRLTRRFVRAAVRLGQLLLVRGELDQVEDLARRALRGDGFCEQAFHLLALVELRLGDRPRAGRVLRLCRARLAELGVTPGAPILRLQRELDGTAAAAPSPGPGRPGFRPGGPVGPHPGPRPAARRA